IFQLCADKRDHQTGEHHQPEQLFPLSRMCHRITVLTCKANYPEYCRGILAASVRASQAVGTRPMEPTAPDRIDHAGRNTPPSSFRASPSPVAFKSPVACFQKVE